MKTIVYFTFLLSFLACSKSNKVKNYINLDIETPTQYNNLSELFDSVKIIPLETTPESYTSKVNKMYIKDGRYYLHGHDVYIFENSGKYVTSTKHLKGRSSKELMNISCMIFNEREGWLEFLDARLRKILIYDMDLNFIKNRKLKLQDEHFAHEIEYLNPDTYILYSSVKDNQHLICYDIKNNQYITTTLLTEKFPLRTIHMSNKRFHKDFTGTFYQSTLNDGMIYKIHTNGQSILEPSLNFNITYNPLKPSDITLNDMDTFWRETIFNFSCFMNTTISDSYYAVTYVHNKCAYHYLYQRSSGKTHNFSHNLKSGEKLVRPYAIIGEYYYTIMSAEDVKEYFQNSTLASSHKEIIDNLNARDNDVIVRYKFKQ